MRLPEDRAKRLSRLADRFRWSLSEAAAWLLEEKLREMEHPLIEFRDSLHGRQAYVKGSSLAVWEVAWLARHAGSDARELAAYLEWPEEKVAAALAYAEEYPEEIEAAIQDNDRLVLEHLRRRIPWLRAFEA